MINTMNTTNQYSTTTIDCEVSFTAACNTTDYGTLFIPKGTLVQRRIVNGKLSDWFIAEPQKLFSTKGAMFQHDAEHYGITIPPQNVYKV